MWASAFKRTKQTAAGIVHGAAGWIPENNCRTTSHLVEQDFGVFAYMRDPHIRRDKLPVQTDHYSRNRSQHAYFARPPGGESPMDVQHRVSPFIGTLMRDKEKKGIEDVVIVTHGVTLRALAMAFLKIDPDRFYDFKNPENASIYMIEGDSAKGRPYSFHQIYNGETQQPVAIDWGRKLEIYKSHFPDVPRRFGGP